MAILLSLYIYICTFLNNTITECLSSSRNIHIHFLSLYIYIHLKKKKEMRYIYKCTKFFFLCISSQRYRFVFISCWFFLILIISAVNSLNVFFFYHPVYIYYILSSRSCTSQTRSCPSRHTAIMAIRRNRCTSSGTVRKSSSRVKTSRSQAQGRTLRLFGTDLMRHAIIRRRSPRVIYCLILYRLTPLVFRP